MGKWQDEYEREWETFTRETLRAQYGRAYTRHRVTTRDKRDLRDLLRDLGSSFDPFAVPHAPDKVAAPPTALRPATSHTRRASTVRFQTPRASDRVRRLSSLRAVTTPLPHESEEEEEEDDDESAFPATQVLVYTQLEEAHDEEEHEEEEESGGNTSDTSMQSDVSYVYQTPQPRGRRVRQRSPAAAVSSAERQHKRRQNGSLARSSTSSFPAFTPHDLHGSRDLSMSRLSANGSQTLRRRLASLSPIAAARLRFSLGSALNDSHTTIGDKEPESDALCGSEELFATEPETAAPLGSDDDMRTPQPRAPLRRDVASGNGSEKVVDLDASMQSMHLDESDGDDDVTMEGRDAKAGPGHTEEEEEDGGRKITAALDFKGVSDDEDEDDEELSAPVVEKAVASPPKPVHGSPPGPAARWHWSETTMQGESESMESAHSDARSAEAPVVAPEILFPETAVHDSMEIDDGNMIPEPEAEEDDGDVTRIEGNDDTCGETEDLMMPMDLEDGDLMSTMLKTRLRNAGLPMSGEENESSEDKETERNLFDSSRVSAAKGSPTASSSSASSPSSRPKAKSKSTAKNLYYRTKLPLRVEATSTRVDDRRRERRQKLKKKLATLPYVDLVPECNVELAPYQREAVEWMLAREEPHVVTESERHTGSTSRQREMYYDRLTSKMRGGILADEMGLGKTVCCIALICESLKKFRSASGESSGSSSSMGGSHSEAMPRIKAPTLIITPLSILGQWEKEIREKTNLSVISYQGHSRRQIQNVMDFMGVDVVLSTYDTLRLKECKVTKGTTRGHDSSDNSHDEADEPSQDAGAIFDQLNNSRQWHTAARRLSHSKKPATLSKLHQLMWHRLILDESHLITNPSCARAKAALVLKSKRRWCVTGTPIQNSGKDLSSLMTFLGMSHVAADLDYHEVLSRVMLRRLKSTVDVDSNEPIVQLPDKQEDVVELDFTSDLEKAYYTLLHRSTKRRVFEYLRKNGRGHGGGQFMHVFELLLRLRQCCDACSLVSDDPKREVQDGDGALLAEIGTLTRQEAALLERASRADPSPNANRFSTKITRLLQELRAMKQNGERGLVVSQWTSFLDLIGEAIQAENAQNPSAERDGTVLRFCRLDGRMSAREREQAIASFQIEKRVDVLLVSIRTGGLGLNLTAASQVFIMEPSWNPSIECQAIDRAHRVGQTRRVRIVRFLMKHTIEERVVELQRKKRELATVTLGDGIASSQPTGTRTPSPKETALSHDELRGLFSQEAVESSGGGGHDDDGEPDDSMEAAIWDDLE